MCKCSQDSVGSRELTDEEKRQMERVTREIREEVRRLLAGRPRKFPNVGKNRSSAVG
jgi:hypothetical protein